MTKFTKHFSQGFYKLGCGSASLAYLSYPVSMIAIQAALGYTVCFALDSWSDISHNRHDTKFFNSVYKNFGYNYVEPPKTFSDKLADVLYQTFESYSTECYLITMLKFTMLNPQHLTNLYEGSRSAVSHFTGAAVDFAKSAYYLGEDGYELYKSHFSHEDVKAAGCAVEFI
jgi:hypothetical protein